MEISRRQVTIAMAAGLAAVGAGLYAFRPPDATSAGRLVGTLADPEAAAEIGATWLSTRADPQAETFRAALAAKLRARTIGPDADDTALADALRALKRRDFLDGNLIDIEGWQLARTEAELCALAALVRAG